MDLVRDVDAAGGKFVVLTNTGIKGFAELERVNEYIQSLNGAAFAVVRKMWTGGATADSNSTSRYDSAKQVEANRKAVQDTLAIFEEMERRAASKKIEVKLEPVPSMPKFPFVKSPAK